MSATLEGVTGSAYGSVSCPLNATLEERVVFLEKAVKNNGKQLYLFNKRFEENNTNIKKAIEAESVQRKDADNENKKLITKAVAGNLIIEQIGILWLFFGIVLASSSVEISCFFT